MITEQNIDYIQFSVDKLGFMKRIGEHRASLMPFYRYSYELDFGLKAHGGNPNTDKWLIVGAGSSCERIERAIGMRLFIDRVLSLGATFSRIDFAVTQFIDEDGLIRPRDYAQWDREGKIKCKFKGAPKSIRNERCERVETLYWGDLKKRGKRGLYRAYDKGLDMDMLPDLIARIEIEERRKSAQSSVRRYAEGAAVADVIATRFTVDDEKWYEMMDARPLDISRGEAKQKDDDDYLNRWKWLVEQVAPALGRQIAYDETVKGTRANYELFNNAVQSAYNKWIRENDNDNE